MKSVAADALVRALARGLYINHSPQAVSLEPADLIITEYQGLDVTEASLTAELDFITPLCIRQGNELQLSAPQIIMSLTNRISGLARWHGLELTEDFGAVSTAVDNLSWAAENVRRVEWRRRSNPQRNSNIPMEGLLGRVHIRGALMELSPILEMGRSCLAGGRAAWGQGRYDLTWR